MGEQKGFPRGKRQVSQGLRNENKLAPGGLSTESALGMIFLSNLLLYVLIVVPKFQDLEGEAYFKLRRPKFSIWEY